MRVLRVTLRDFRGYAIGGDRPRRGPDGHHRSQRRRQDEPARGAVLRLHRAVVPDVQRARGGALRTGHDPRGGHGRGRRRPPRADRRLHPGGTETDAGRRGQRRAPARRHRPAAAQRVPARPPGADQGHTVATPRSPGPVRGRDVAGPRDDPPRVRPEPGAAQRADRPAAVRPGLACLAAQLGSAAGPAWRRADGRSRRGRGGDRRPLRRDRRGARARRRAGAGLPPALEGHAARRSSATSSRPGPTPISSAASPATAPIATSSPPSAPAGSCAPTARRDSSAWPCSRCCWPNARRSGSAGPRRR